MITKKLAAIWRIITAQSVTLLTHHQHAEMPFVTSFGRGDISDMVLTVTAMRKLADGLTTSLNEAAAEAGELHTLQELRDAVEALEGK